MAENEGIKMEERRMLSSSLPKKERMVEGSKGQKDGKMKDGEEGEW